VAVFSDDDAAALYAAMYPWDPEIWPAGQPLLMWHEVESVAGDVITLTETTAGPGGTVLRTDRAGLRFLSPAALDTFLARAGFGIEARYGDWQHGPVTGTSREIITIARRA
jgi:hypothetical protein